MSKQQDPHSSRGRPQVEVARRSAIALKIMVHPEARYGNYPASDAIVRAARQLGLAQPIVTGMMGRYRRFFARLLRIDHAAPVIVEIIGSRPRLEALSREVQLILPDAIVSWENVEVWVPLEVIEN